MSARATPTLQPLIAYLQADAPARLVAILQGRQRPADRPMLALILDEITYPAICKRVRRNGDARLIKTCWIADIKGNTFMLTIKPARNRIGPNPTNPCPAARRPLILRAYNELVCERLAAMS